MKKCPHCAEEIQIEAIKCRYCGSMVFPERMTAWINAWPTLTQIQRDQAWAAMPDQDRRELTAGIQHATQLGAAQAVAARASSGTTSTTNAVAAIASFFIPGLGQIAQGRVGAGIAVFFISALMWVFLLGWIGHIAAAIDCAVYKGP